MEHMGYNNSKGFSIDVQSSDGTPSSTILRYHPLDEYRKSGVIYPSVSAILENAPKGWGSVDFPTDKAPMD